ncbi:triose-phosphate isomerase [Marinicauda salina]|uniref:Triosephosphate isomerase n=1 Tax=Marinicauda salina TaxID=2135793 RepID=A0A2U2BTA0_9PROT|nr:triose-phosphate isomerase [Marinicauda salina]PWE17225.1 triose-phosphate isomerase [Marinicauda salina]
MARRAMIAGNWKMNGLSADLAWAETFLGAVEPAAVEAGEVLLCPPATLIADFARRFADAPVALGGQDCAAQESGAHTGDISAAMLADLGCTHVIVGHSERRAGHGETDAHVHAKAAAALEAGLTPIVCVGETLDQREAGEAEAVVVNQLRASAPDAAAERVVVAYEPVWAIGTGRTAAPEDAQAMHAAIRAAWPGDDGDRLRILYGGSVKPANAAELLRQPDLDGALVGGASLDPEAFAAIVNAVR